jgi:hypothetical protein
MHSGAKLEPFILATPDLIQSGKRSTAVGE